MSPWCNSLLVLLVVALVGLVLQVKAGGNILQVNAGGKTKESSITDIIDGARIVGGQQTSSKKFPWQVYVRRKKLDGTESGGCGGSIISTNWVMSAAHCFTESLNDNEFIIDVTRIYLYAGVTDKRERDSDPAVQLNIIDEGEIEDHLFIHPDYEKETYLNNDIALIKLKKPLNITEQVQPISLATLEDFIPEKQLIASGWGRTSENGYSSNILLFVDGLNLISREECKKYWGADRITDSMICHRTDDRNTCSGDSGGPVITGQGDSNGPPYVQIGIVSWGSSTCDSNRAPKVFVDVAKFTDWITYIIASDCVDVEGETNCQYWASLEYCIRGIYTNWMEINCKKSCTKCNSTSDLFNPRCNNDICEKETAGTTEPPLKCTSPGYFRDPNDCTKYILCQDLENNNYLEHFLSCSNGLYFNPRINACDWPHNVSSCQD